MYVWHLKDEAIAESFVGRKNYISWSYLVALISVFMHYVQGEAEAQT